MRLLERRSDGGFSLTKNLIDDSIPPYAILSHTWGHDSQEVTFEDIVNESGRNKAGYEKIRFCGEQAARDGLQYFWVDSCCIRKSSDAELSEAINSMFRWYQCAEKCYVYLSDVSTKNIEGIDEDSQWEQALCESRWFTRGWTLQELLAPRTVEFFSKEISPLGDKKLLEQVIHDITGIDLEALRGNRPLHEFSVDERMSWAKSRETTRQEDAAYCLLGIFDIHMPLIYGEGRKKALSRLRKEIQDTQHLPSVLFKDVRTILSSAASENRLFKTFTRSFNDAPVDLLSVHFMERERELGLIRDAHQVNDENSPARCAIWGIPGVGKTQLAIRYTKKFLEDGTVSAVFWISCSNVEKLHQGFSKLLDLIAHPDRFKLEQNARVIEARRWLEQPEVSGIQRWLLVLDNVDKTTLEFLRENLPRQGKQGRILVTTRTEAVAHAVCKASGKLQQYFELEPPVMQDAIVFFLKSVRVSEDSLSSDSRNQVTDLIKSLGRLPFAVEHAASFMTQSSQTIDNFTRLYRGNEKSHVCSILHCYLILLPTKLSNYYRFLIGKTCSSHTK
jgi:NB-ARC domain/Heterokaryon incompatibility protein (HET)